MALVYIPNRTTPLLAAAVGSGAITRAAVESGADALLALNAGVYRHLGVGSLGSFLASGNANTQTLELLRTHILPQRANVPVYAGVLSSDPALSLDSHWHELRQLGVEGVTNWPTAGFIDGQLRVALETEGLGIEGEAAMLHSAQLAGFSTLAFAFTENEVRTFLDAGVNGLVLNLGLTQSISDLPERRDRLQETLMRLKSLLQIVRQSRPQNAVTVCLAFGGPIISPEDFETVFRQTNVDGFAGGSVFERIPVQETVAATVRGFKAVRRHELNGINAPLGLGELLGQSQPMRHIFRLIEKLAPSEINLCLGGETGTGKEVAANLLHRLSPRAAAPFVTVNCGSIPDALLESEFFGHEKGAFTGAHRRRLGKFELAHLGTLFLDEIGDLSPHGQVALLRVLQQREITRVGAETDQSIDVRIITASHLDLEVLVQEGKFRSDLFFRLSEFRLVMPPLRERLDDLPILVDSILARLGTRLGRQLVGLTAAFYEKLRLHSWPGNIRELQHVLTQAALLENNSVLSGLHFFPSTRVPAEKLSLSAPTPAKKSKIEQQQLARNALAKGNGNKSEAARALGITRRTLYIWLKQLE